MVVYGANGVFVTMKGFVLPMIFKHKVVVAQVVISNKELVRINVLGANGVDVVVKHNVVQERHKKEHVVYVVHKAEVVQDVHGVIGVLVRVKANVDKVIQGVTLVGLH
jgi:hypothetical protein